MYLPDWYSIRFTTLSNYYLIDWWCDIDLSLLACWFDLMFCYSYLTCEKPVDLNSHRQTNRLTKCASHKKNKNNKKCVASKFLSKIRKILPKMTTKIFLFRLFKLTPRFNYVLKWTWELIRMRALILHGVKSVHIWSFSGRYFPAFRFNTERYGVSLTHLKSVWKIISKISGKNTLTDSSWYHHINKLYCAIRIWKNSIFHSFLYDKDLRHE